MSDVLCHSACLIPVSLSEPKARLSAGNPPVSTSHRVISIQASVPGFCIGTGVHILAYLVILYNEPPT